MTREVWFAIPSASVQRCRARLPAWRERGYRVAVLQNRERGEIPADIVRWSDAYPGWSASINILCREVVPPSADIVVSGGDDMLPDPNHSAQELAEQFFDRFPDGFGVMQPHGDTFMNARRYCGSPWLGRGWIARAYGGRGPMPPEYRHNWADNELYWVARCLGSLWSRPDLSQPHEHHTRLGETAPAWWRAEVEANDRRDLQTFLARCWQRFPGCEPLGGGRTFDAAEFERAYDGSAEAVWAARYGLDAAGGEAARRLRAAMESLASRGLRRVAVYGAGSHTRACAGVLMRPPVDVVCIIDDAPAMRGERLWNYPVVPLDAVRGRGGDGPGVDAVIISSAALEPELHERAGPLEAAGVEVVRLYADAAPTEAIIP